MYLQDARLVNKDEGKNRVLQRHEGIGRCYQQIWVQLCRISNQIILETSRSSLFVFTKGYRDKI